MFFIKIPETIKELAMLSVTKYNRGKRGEFDGDQKHQYYGTIGEYSVALIFNDDLRFIADKSDKGIDISYSGLKIDVKTHPRKTDPKDYFDNRVPAVQVNYQTDIFIFCTLNISTEMLFICGWLPKWEFLNKAIYESKGTKNVRSDGTFWYTYNNSYKIKNSELKQVNSQEELLIDIYNYSLI